MQTVAWTIAGSDCSSCAGIQADLKTLQNFGVHGCSVITAITAQNTKKLSHIDYISEDLVAAQITILKNNIAPKAIKIGIFKQEKISNFLFDYDGHVVLDPIIYSTSGRKLFLGDLEDHLFLIKNICHAVDIITPNLLEAEILAGRKINSYQDIEKAAEDILSLGVKSVLIKGGHFIDEKFCQDYWTNGTDSFWVSNERILKTNLRGTGCTLSSAITACLALGYDIKDAIVLAKMYINQGIRLTQDVWLNHANCLYDKNDFPDVIKDPMQLYPTQFPDCGEELLGLYPIIDNAAWINQLAPLGITTMQLRIKDKVGAALKNEIRCGIEFAKKNNIRLFINDYWDLAIRFGAYGVHLGQGDLLRADIQKIHLAGLRLGISTHSYYEAAYAHALRPSYIACGPVFPTTSKIMPFRPLGLDKLKNWQRMLDYPVVAIGGINFENFPAVLKIKVDGIAMISAIFKTANPILRAKQFLHQMSKIKCI